MVYCPRCGLEVSDEVVYCPRCGTEVQYRKASLEPERRDVVEHLKYAIRLAREKPMVFGPSFVELVIALVNQRMIASWTVLNDFIDALLDYFYYQTGVSPVSYVSTGFEFEYSRFISWVLAALIGLSIISWIASLASIRASWRAVRGEEPTIQDSFVFVGRRILRFIIASILFTLFFVIVSLVTVVPLIFSESIGFGPAFLFFFIAMIGLLVLAILTAPTFIIMVGEDEEFIPSLRKTLAFTRTSFWRYIGLGILLVIIAFVLSLVPYVGYYLTFVVGVIWNISIIDLYNQFKAVA